jgi:hypothetical protein
VKTWLLNPTVLLIKENGFIEPCITSPDDKSNDAPVINKKTTICKRAIAVSTTKTT